MEKPFIKKVEREILINQYKILANTSSCPNEKKDYEIRKEILEKRMESHMGYAIFGEYEDQERSDRAFESSALFYDILCMYEYVRIFLLNNNISDESLVGQKLRVPYDGHECGSFPYYNLEVLQKENRFWDIEFYDQHSTAIDMHKERLEEYKKNKINMNNYKLFIE